MYIGSRPGVAGVRFITTTVLAVVLLFCFTTNTVVVADSARCGVIAKGSVCDGVLDYTSVYLADGACSDSYEFTALQAQNIFSVLSSGCRDATATFVCSKLYPPCHNDTSDGVTPIATPTCRSLCTAVSDRCSATEKTTLLAQISIFVTPSDCAAFPTASCYAGQTSSFVQTTAYARCEREYTGSICRGVVSYPIYVPAHMTQELLEARIESARAAFLTAPRSNGCNVAFAKYLCAQVFLRCDDGVSKRALGIDIPIPFLSQPCRSLCTDFAETCSSFIAQQPRLTPQCNKTGTYIMARSACGVRTTPAGDDFPLYNTTFVKTATFTLATQCNNYYYSDSSTNNQLTPYSVSVDTACPAPLVRPDHPDTTPTLNDGLCAMPCPLPFLTYDEYRAQEIVSVVLHWIGAICAVFLAVTWAVFKRKQEYTLLIMIGQALIIVVNLPYAYVTNDGVLAISRNNCADNANLINRWTQSGGYCMLAGTLQAFAVMFALTWFFVSCTDIWIRVVLPGNYFNDQKRRIINHVFCWSMSFGSMAIAVGTNSIGGVGLNPFCGISGDWAQWALIYWPILICGTIGTVLMSWVAIEVIRSAKRSQSSAVTWKTNVRMIYYLFCYDAVFCLVVAFRLDTWFRTDAIAASTQAWVQCLFTGGSATADSCGLHPSVRPDYTLSWFLIVNLPVMGIICFSIFGTFENNYTLWAAVCCQRCGYKPRGTGVGYGVLGGPVSTNVASSPHGSNKHPTTPGNTSHIGGGAGVGGGGGAVKVGATPTSPHHPHHHHKDIRSGRTGSTRVLIQIGNTTSPRSPTVASPGGSGGATTGTSGSPPISPGLLTRHNLDSPTAGAATLTDAAAAATSAPVPPAQGAPGSSPPTTEVVELAAVGRPVLKTAF